MRSITKFLKLLNRKHLSNPHFWVITLLICGITFIYYFYSYPSITIKDDYTLFFWRLAIFEYQINIHGLLLFIPMLYALIFYKWTEALKIWAFGIIIITPYLLLWSYGLSKLILNYILLSVPFMVIGFVIYQFKWRDNYRKIMQEREIERQAYMAQIFKAQENERQRIAHELHDESSQTLLAIANRTQSLVNGEYNILPIEALRQAEWIRDMVMQVSREIRRLSRDLRPSILDNIGLVPALSWLVNRDHSTHASLVVSGTERTLTPEIEVMIFRIVQEALNNIRRHAKAERATVNLTFEKHTLRLTIIDNGQGFELPRKMANLTGEGKLGLIGMQQRANFMHGKFDIQSQPGKGTTISISLNT